MMVPDIYILFVGLINTAVDHPDHHEVLGLNNPRAAFQYVADNWSCKVPPMFSGGPVLVSLIP